MVQLNLNIEKKHLYLLSAIVVFLVGVGIVISYGGTTPAVMGHSFGEIAPPASLPSGSCSGKYLKVDDGGRWDCAAPTFTFTETDPKVGTLNTDKMCISDGSKINCASDFPKPSYDSGWVSLANYHKDFTHSFGTLNYFIYVELKYGTSWIRPLDSTSTTEIYIQDKQMNIVGIYCNPTLIPSGTSCASYKVRILAWKFPQ